jgi:hypothetical protein
MLMVNWTSFVAVGLGEITADFSARAPVVVTLRSSRPRLSSPPRRGSMVTLRLPIDCPPQVMLVPEGGSRGGTVHEELAIVVGLSVSVAVPASLLVVQAYASSPSR